jgi:hypothetical protein
VIQFIYFRFGVPSFDRLPDGVLKIVLGGLCKRLHGALLGIEQVALPPGI